MVRCGFRISFYIIKKSPRSFLHIRTLCNHEDSISLLFKTLQNGLNMLEPPSHATLLSIINELYHLPDSLHHILIRKTTLKPCSEEDVKKLANHSGWRANLEWQLLFFKHVGIWLHITTLFRPSASWFKTFQQPRVHSD